jgi:hypothetical protein
MKMKLFRYGYLLRITFDHGKIFSIMSQQRGFAKLIAGIIFHVTEFLNILWIGISEMLFKVTNILFAHLSAVVC